MQCSRVCIEKLPLYMPLGCYKSSERERGRDKMLGTVCSAGKIVTHRK